MKKSKQSKMTLNIRFDMGAIVQMLLHKFDMTKPDGENLTLSAVEVDQKRKIVARFIAKQVRLAFWTDSTIQAT
jgi:hypothetical protein